MTAFTLHNNLDLWSFKTYACFRNVSTIHAEYLSIYLPIKTVSIRHCFHRHFKSLSEEKEFRFISVLLSKWTIFAYF